MVKTSETRTRQSERDERKPVSMEIYGRDESEEEEDKKKIHTEKKSEENEKKK